MLHYKRLKVTRLSLLPLPFLVLLLTLISLSKWQMPTEASAHAGPSSHSRSKGGHHVKGNSISANHKASQNSSSGRQLSSGTASTSAAANQPAAGTPPANSPYPWHNSINTTVFWAGEGASPDNDYIDNRSSAWMTDWLGAFGGIDAQHNRCGYNPCGFIPNENTFYFALPFSDYNDNGPKSNLTMVPWYNGPLRDGDSLLKNRWVEIRYNGKLAYAQWEDVGPYAENDSGYVFGSQAPRQRVGLDVSPATSDFLGTGDQAVTSWRFISQSEVPSGPWKVKITSSLPRW